MYGGARFAAGIAWLAVAATALVGCATVPLVQLAYMPGVGDTLIGSPRPCADDVLAVASAPDAERLPGPQLRVLSWNLHKNADPGWEADLARYAAESDLVLLQEAALTPALRKVLGGAGHVRWTLAGSWGWDGVETGVLAGARAAPLASCVQRSIEPLLQLPKAALIATFAIDGTHALLAVATLHSVNFTLGTGAYAAQLDALVRALAGHRGPLIVAGDFNTWSAAREQALRAAMDALGLTPVLPASDTRTRVFGRHVDHVYVRGLAVVDVSVPQVGSSDHNPVLATLRLLPH